jgi:hypothetical protein
VVGDTVGGSFTFTYYAGDSVSGTGSATPPTQAGDYTVVAHFSSTDPDYASGDSTPLTFTIAQAPLTITANDRSKTYGDALALSSTAFTTGAGQLVSGDSVSGVTLASDGAAATAPVSGSPYAIVASSAAGTGLSNYAITYVNGSLTVNPAPLTITADNPPVNRLPANPPAGGNTSSGPAVGFVSVAFGPFGEVMEVVNSTGMLTQIDAFGAHVLGGGVRAASVAFGPSGEELLLTFQNGALTLFDSAGAHPLGTSGVLSASIAFGPQGMVVEVVAQDGTLRQFDAGGAHVLGGGVSSTSVAEGPGGEVLLVTFQNGQLIQFDLGPHALGGGVVSAGVGFDATGAEVIDVLTRDGTLTQYDATGIHVLGKVA